MGGMGGEGRALSELADSWLPPHTHTGNEQKYFVPGPVKDLICGRREMISSPLLFSPVPCVCYTAPDGPAPTRSSHTSFERVTPALTFFCRCFVGPPAL